MLFETFPENRRVWVYSSNRFLIAEEKTFIEQKLKNFISQWATQGKDLYADAAILHNNFITISVDESKIPSSGCSIDSSVRFMKELGKELNIDFFNRLSVLIEKDGELKRIHYNEIGEYTDWNLFNPVVNTIDELRNNWLIPIVGSVYSR
jgi:hypothetical protein